MMQPSTLTLLDLSSLYLLNKNRREEHIDPSYYLAPSCHSGARSLIGLYTLILFPKLVDIVSIGRNDINI